MEVRRDGGRMHRIVSYFIRRVLCLQLAFNFTCLDMTYIGQVARNDVLSMAKGGTNGDV